MPVKIKLPTVFTTNNGYTLLEATLGLLMVSIIAMFLMQLTMVISISSASIDNTRDLTMLKMIISDDLILANHVNVINHNLVIDLVSQPSTTNQITYQAQNNKLVRKKNGRGSETVLGNIYQARFSQKNNKIFLTVKFRQDEPSEEVFITNQK